MKHLLIRVKNFILLEILPKGIMHKRWYQMLMHKKLDLKHPKDFNEKLQWLMVHMDARRMSVYADKIAVRDYVRQKGYSNILTTLYGPENRGGGYNKFDEINFDELPEKFVLKPNHGSGGVFICTNKKNFDYKKTKQRLEADLKIDYAAYFLEYHYHYIKPQIMCEEYLEMEGMKNPLDYKFHCFNGEVDCVELCSEREVKTKLEFYDLNWNKLPYSTERYKSSVAYEKPENFDEMIKIASDFAKDFLYVRVDLYNIKGKIYFGELTLSPAGGLHDNIPQEALDILGSKLKLPFEK